MTTLLQCIGRMLVRVGIVSGVSRLDLQRRHFLYASGATVSAAALSACSSAMGVAAPADARRRAVENERRVPIDTTWPPILQTLALGLNAPSPHNTQSWLFDIVSDHEALLRVDRTRLLPQTDPPARQTHIGCGCFLEAAVLGASSIGWQAEVELFPKGAYRDASDIGRVPVARLRLVDKTETAQSLAPFIFSRQTSRLPYTGEWITNDAFGRVLRDARINRSQARFIAQAGLAPYLDLFDRAMTLEFSTLATNEETRRWFRFSSDEASETRDGLTFEANGVTGLSAMFARWFTDDTQESWNDESTTSKGLDSFREGLYSARGLVFVSTISNTFDDHIEAGRDCYQLMLALTKHGYFCHPCNQAIQEYAEMDKLRSEFESLSGIRAPGKVQMILRIGKSETPFQSYRRELRSFVAEQEGPA